MPFLVGIFLTFPLFFTKGFRVYSGGMESHEFAMPLSVFASGLVLLLNVHYVIAAMSRIIPLLFFIGVFSISTIALLFLWGGDPSLLAIYMIPALLGFFLPWAIRLNSSEDLVSLFHGVVFAMALAATLHLIASFYEFGVVGAFVERGVDSIFGVFSIYQKFIYYSTLLSVACLFVVLHVKGVKKYLLLFVLAADLILIGAREALLLLIFFFLASGIVLKQSLPSRIVYSIVYSCVGVGVFLIFYLVGQAYFPDVAIIAKLGTTFGADGSADMSAGRVGTIQNVVASFNIDSLFWFFGSGFSTVEGELGTPHNQYIEWFLRGGLIFVFFNLFFLFIAALSAIRSRNICLVTIGIVLCSIVVFSNNINTPFRTPYSSVLLWCLIGIVFRFSSFGRASNVFPPASAAKDDVL